MVICLMRGADLHTALLMPLPLTVSCFSKIEIGFTFLVLARPGSPGQRAVKRMCVCVCYSVALLCQLWFRTQQVWHWHLLALPAWYAEQDLCIGQASVRLFVCPIVCPLHSIAAFAALGPAGRRCQWIAAWPVLSSKCDQCHVDSWCRKLNTRLVDVQTVLPAWCFDSVYQIREKWLNALLAWLAWAPGLHE